MCARLLDDLLRSPESQAALLTGPLAGLAITGTTFRPPVRWRLARLAACGPFARDWRTRCDPSAT
jgi:hypothetical protein